MASLGASPPASLKILCVSAILLVRTRRRRSARRWFRLALHCRGVPIRCVVSEYSDLVVLRECFVEDQYAVPRDHEPSIILDVGANSGFSVLHFRTAHPTAQIFAVEPDPHAFAKLEANTAGWPGIVLRRCAVGESDGRRPFYCSAESWTSSLVPLADWDVASDVLPIDPRAQEVDVRTLSSLLEDLGINRVDVLKLDVEGAEWELLEDLAAMRNLSVVLAELHWDVAAAPERAPVETILPGYDVAVTSSHGQRCTISAVCVGR